MVYSQWRSIGIAVVCSFGIASVVGAQGLDELNGSATVSSAAVARPSSRCPSWSMQFSVERTAGELSEVSGIVGSRLTPDHWWVHNDSGDSARVFLIDSTLKVTAVVGLADVGAIDFEDIAIDGAGMIWVADVGDNLKIRPAVQLYGFAEPSQAAAMTVGAVPARKLEITYPDGAHDVETLMIDARTGDGFLVDKRPRAGRAAVFRIPAAAFQNGGSVRVEQVTSIDVSSGGDIGPTAGDISLDGSMIVIKTLTTAYLWPRGRNLSVVEALAASPVAPCTVPEAGSNEAIGFDRGANRLVAVSEGLGARLRTFTLRL